MKHPHDTDLDFLYACPNDELELLVRLVVDAGGRTGRLARTASFRLHHPDHGKYVDELVEELQTFAGNTLANVRRGHGVPYLEALRDTLDELHVGYDRRMSLAQLESLLLTLGKDAYLSRIPDGTRRAAFAEALETGRCGELRSGVGWRQWTELFLAAVCAPLPVLLYLSTPASRVTVPAVLYIASLRRRHAAGGRRRAGDF